MRKQNNAAYAHMSLDAKLWICEQKALISRIPPYSCALYNHGSAQAPIFATWTSTALSAPGPRAAKLPASGSLKEKGHHILAAFGSESSLSLSNGWLECFKRRHKFKCFAVHGEANDVDQEGVEKAIVDFIFETSQFELKNIFNADESGVFYSMPPPKSVSRTRIQGRKNEKGRLTALSVVNADGSEKRDILFIGTAARPEAFGRQRPSTMGFTYSNSEKAWMNRVIFEEWLMAFNRDMREQGRRVLLLMDNAKVHQLDWKRVRPSNVVIYFLPKNATARIQPLDAGIIASFKRRFQKRKLKAACRLDEIGCANPYKMDIRQAMEMLTDAWSDVTPETIANCWRHCGFLFHQQDLDTLSPELQALWTQLSLDR